MQEIDSIKNRYAKRKHRLASDVYSYLRPDVYMTVQEKERHLIRWLKDTGWQDISHKKILEVGCGTGGNLYTLMRMGFNPEHLVGNELLPERYEASKRSLPDSVLMLCGDACELDLQSESFDVVLQSTVFTSILSDAFQERLAANMWRMVKPGGGILWYDFTYNNPKNPDVRGVPLSRIFELFPAAKISARRLTLAPPISRRVCKIYPPLYHVFNCVPFLRTHLLCWIEKPQKIKN